jgi:glutaredoxin-like protein NrdH
LVREKMNVVKVAGKNKSHKVLIYALSTCAWCKMTKQYFKDNDFEFEYVDVDLANDEDHEKIREDIEKRGASPSFPTIIVDGKTVITGFRKDLIKEAVGI